MDIFDPADEWSVPLGKYAQRPDPLCSHCFVKFDCCRAILFGGRHVDEKRNETRIFNFTDRVNQLVVKQFIANHALG